MSSYEIYDFYFYSYLHLIKLINEIEIAKNRSNIKLANVD